MNNSTVETIQTIIQRAKKLERDIQQLQDQFHDFYNDFLADVTLSGQKYHDEFPKQDDLPF